MITRLLMGAERGTRCRTCNIVSTRSMAGTYKYSAYDFEMDVEKRVAAATEKRRLERLILPPTADIDKKGYQIKVLCPSIVTEQMPEYGAEWIAELSKLSGARIKISLDGEFFPFTEDRVISISGDYQSIVAAIDALVLDLLKVR